MSKELQQLNSLLEYVKKIGELHQKIIFKIEDYKKVFIYEDTLQEIKGVHFNTTNNDNGEPIWLKIDRLKRTDPPIIDEDLKDWIVINKDPNNQPIIKSSLIKTLTQNEKFSELKKGFLLKEDVKEPLKNDTSSINLFDVIYKIENLPHIKQRLDDYIQDKWYKWQLREIPFRKSIEIYEQFFNIHNAIHNGSDEEQVELVWGTGIVLWNYEEHIIKIPLIEQLIDIHINNSNGSIEISPRIIEHKVQLDPFIQLEINGVENILNFVKSFYSNENDILFSPYESETFESLLRQVVTHLDSKGSYYPDISTNLTDKTLPKVSKELVVTDTSVIYLRPRESRKFLEDIKSFQKILSNKQEIEFIKSPVKKIVTKQSNEIIQDNLSINQMVGYNYDNDDTDIYFPKPYNDTQEKIITTLRHNNGVVVQGPPGTGKTHTIANIICHYLATGKKILVTSEHEPALSVIQEQLPEEIRKLTISILTDEKDGNKQLERAINILQSLATRTDTNILKNQKKSLIDEVKKLRNEINVIEVEIKEWSNKQMQSIPIDINDYKYDITAMDLANEIVREKDKHEWFKDEIDHQSKYNPLFSNEDIYILKQLRQKILIKIEYVDEKLFSKNDLPELVKIISIHNDLLKLDNIEAKFKNDNVPIMSKSIENFNTVSDKLKQDIDYILYNQNIIEDNLWVKNALGNEVFDELYKTLSEISQERMLYLKNVIKFNEFSDMDSNKIVELLEILRNGKKPFGLFSFGKKIEKTIIDNITINGESPKTKEEWSLVYNYMFFQIKIKKFLVQWNHIGEELKLPNIIFSFGLLYKELSEIKSNIDVFLNIQKKCHDIQSMIIKLFPYGINTQNLCENLNELKNILEYIDINISKINLDNNKTQYDNLYEMISKYNNTISRKFKVFLLDMLGNIKYSTNEIKDIWTDLVEELNQIHTLNDDFNMIKNIVDKIEKSGAKIWAKKLKTIPANSINDELTPTNWYDSWQWKRKSIYIQNISGREKSKILLNDRSIKEKQLQKAFTQLIEVNTSIGLQNNLTDLVKSSLSKFQDAIRKIGKGTGKKASRLKKEAQNAMKNCYSGIPCWIMPLWRISETLPSEFDMFDLVIIDEASQSDIKAITAIMRAKKILIVGDDKQVSPSVIGIKEEVLLQLKHNFLREQPNASQLMLGSSIYDLARVIFPSQHIMLTEHFRCVEPIIRFSMQFYTEDLIPLRIPKFSERLDPPLIDVYVKGGIREKNEINSSEIDAIVTEIKLITNDEQYLNRSIGVISLIGRKQAHAIQNRLLSELGEEIYSRHNIFCADASSFQGKEKDIMFLSLVVGKEQGSAMTKLEYEQRFNVALSRARDRMYLYRSIEDTDLQNFQDLRLKVIQHFKNPMPNQYKNISDNLELCDSDFERDVYTKLHTLGYKVRPQVSVGSYSIDLVVEDGKDKRLAIELDGDRYHTPEHWLNDWNRQRVLERVGWIFWRCWGSDYLIDPNGCIEDLIKKLDSLGIQPSNDEIISHKFVEHRVYNIVEN